MKQIFINFYTNLGNLVLRKLYPYSYKIKESYLPNYLASPYLDNEDFAKAYQQEVYRLASKLFRKYKCTSVIDVGCGYGVKLIAHFSKLTRNISGIDTAHSINYCLEKYPQYDWYIDNIENPKLTLNHKYDLVISSDVIEHLKNPDNLINYIKKLAHQNTIIVISTPERDLVRGKEHHGPSPNPAHVREWNQQELRAYIKSHDLKILSSHLVKDKNSVEKDKQNRRYGATCQVFVCKLRS